MTIEQLIGEMNLSLEDIYKSLGYLFAYYFY